MLNPVVTKITTTLLVCSCIITLSAQNKKLEALVKQQIRPPTAIGKSFPLIPIPPQGYSFDKAFKFY